MFDDRDIPGEEDVVHSGNEKNWREQFCEKEGHSMECVRATTLDMAALIKKVCKAFGDIPVDLLIKKIGVEEFDIRLRNILASKGCNCKNEKAE